MDISILTECRERLTYHEALSLWTKGPMSQRQGARMSQIGDLYQQRKLPTKAQMVSKPLLVSVVVGSSTKVVQGY